MLIYFDESYDRRHRYLLLGALFVPSRRSRRIHKTLSFIKEKHRTVAPGHSFDELKYSRSGDKYTFAACKDTVDAFMASGLYFRAIAVDTHLPGFSWDYFGAPNMRKALKKALAYNKFAELLLRYNVGNTRGAVLLADSLTRTPGDNFAEFLSYAFGPAMTMSESTQTAPIRHVQSVNTRLRQYQVGQICDLLLGSVLGDLVPPDNPNKRALVEYVRTQIGVPNFSAAFWGKYPKYLLEARYPKFQVWHWRPG